MKKVVIAIDSFKGCLPSAEAGKAAAEGIRSVYPECEVICLPIADGGEGMLDVLIMATNGQEVPISAHDPLMRWRNTYYGISENGETAFIEMASISGLPLVPPERRNPMLTTTYGTGEIIRDALERGCRNFIIGIGGSATNDAGLGMLQALGFRFSDKEGKEVGTGRGEVLIKVAHIDSTCVHPALNSCRFTVACDVQNPFYGPEGAAYVFAPQKGADREMVEALDAGLQNFAEVIRHTTGKDISHHPGAGAAGIQLMLEALNFSNKIKSADLIITGEGKADRQTLMGKVPSGILAEARKQNIPVILLAGNIEDSDELQQAGFEGVFSVNPPFISLEEAMRPEVARKNIQQTVESICKK